MRRLLAKIFSPWLLVFIGLASFTAVIWWVGPLISIGPYRPLDSETTRWTVIGGFVGLYLASKLLAAWQKFRANLSMSKQLTAAPPDDKGAQETPEEKQLRERFDQALQLLRKARFDTDRSSLSTLSARFGKRYLYELPWYLIIGAPGSGKTTALLNAGLRFPLSATSGNKPGGGLAGVGGTRNCDWWFTDQAVLIDTAGRYTTQDSDAQGDKTAWQRFLELLKRSRPRQPINGALVTVSIPDLLQQSAAERERQIAAVRSRVQELHQHFGVRFPVYLLVTKADLISGFVDYLGAADQDTRATPWGFSFHKDMAASQRPAAFTTEFDLLASRLNDGLVDRLQLEHDPARRSRIYGFPQQFTALRTVLAQFVDGVFAPSQFEQEVMLRGVYFVSGTQEGTPLDRIIGQVARSYQLARTPVPAHSGSAKSFFLERLLQDVVFAESALGGTNLKWERRRGALALAGYAVVGLAAVAMAALWTRSYVANQAYVAAVATRADAAQQLLTALQRTRPDDLAAPLAALDAARAVATPQGEAPTVNLGLGQQRKLEAAAAQTYERLLAENWLPRIVARFERTLAISGTDPTLRYEMLKAYRMLHAREHFDAKAFSAYLNADWELMGSELNEAQRESMQRHLSALLEDGAISAPGAENTTLVAQVRASLVAMPLARRIYTRIKLLGVGDFPEFTLAKAGGTQTQLVFTRTSGQPLTRGVPGLYTYEGYHKGFTAVADKVSRQLAEEEQWVLGVTDATRATAPAAAPRLVGKDPVLDEVRRLYLNDYAALWEAYIRDIRVLPLRSLREAIQTAQIVGAPASPLPPAMRALSRETTLAAKPTGTIDKARAQAGSVLQQGAEEIGKIFERAGAKPTAAATPQLSAEVELVDSRFQALRDLVGTGGGSGPAPIDAAVTLINEIYTHLNTVDAALQAKTAPPPSPVAAKVKNEAPRLPEPVRSMVTSLNDAAQRTSIDGLRSNLSDIINAEVGEFCRKATAGRYPFVRSSAQDVTPDDFARLFAAGGLFDSTFQKYLAANVNTTTRPWSFRKIDGGPSLGAPGTLVQFQRAADIRDAFFRDGKPGMRLEFKVVELDQAITQFTLDVDGQQLKYAHGPITPMMINWPGSKGSNQVRVTVAPPGPSGSTGSLSEGPWALLRMLDRQQVELSTTASEKAMLKFVVDSRSATFEVTSSSVQNPLRLKALQEFACPGGL